MTKKLTISVVLLTMFILTPFSANADYLDLSSNSHITDNLDYLKSIVVNNADTYEDAPNLKNSPQAEPIPVPAPYQKAKVVKADPVATYVVMASAYSSTPDQTDDTPFITAWGTRVRDGIIATNFLPFGTTIKIPELYGNKVFVVEDRMNKRYAYKIDIWFPERSQAMEFGNKKVKMEVLAKI